ncbi:MAG: OB-fold domain-containing protein, partial [Acidimicrobiia bacterium]
ATGVGNTGAAHPVLLLASALERARPGQTIALVVLADGADALILRTTAALATSSPTVAAQVDGGAPIAYGKYLAWRGLLPVEPPRRPEPARPSASAAGRAIDWKFGFVGSESDDGTVHLPPSPQDAESRPMADAIGTIVTFTIDRLSYSPSPPIVFAVVDFDGGGRLPIELTDVDPGEVAIGGRIELTFRRLFTADGIANYFWKGRLVREGA